jgi:hypothetical protein
VERPETLRAVADNVVIVAFVAESVWVASVFVIDTPDSVASPHTFSVVTVSVPDTFTAVADRVVITELRADKDPALIV